MNIYYIFHNISLSSTTKPFTELQSFFSHLKSLQTYFISTELLLSNEHACFMGVFEALIWSYMAHS